MVPPSKRSKRRGEDKSKSSSEAGNKLEGEMGLESEEYHSGDSEQFDDDDGGSDFDGNGDEENGMDDDEDEEESEREKFASQKDAEMEELEKEYNEIRNKEQDLLKNLQRHKDEDALKGQAVKNQKALWDKTLEFRFLLQKAFSSSNKLPLEPIKSSLCSSDTAADQAYSDLVFSCKQTIDSMLELEDALLEQNNSITQGTIGNIKEPRQHKDSIEVGVDDDEDWLKIERMHYRIIPFRNSSVDKWHRKTHVSTGAAAFKGKLHAFNQNISEQVAGYMRDPSRMIKRMQLRRSSVGIFGKVIDDAGSTKEEDIVDADPELLDDSEFYQQLLKEFFESCDLTSSETAFYALKKLQPKKRKVVDRRASKSRKIRYNVHEKIANFMAPVPMNLPPVALKLFENLFGRGNQKTSSVC